MNHDFNKISKVFNFNLSKIKNFVNFVNVMKITILIFA